VGLGGVNPAAIIESTSDEPSLHNRGSANVRRQVIIFATDQTSFLRNEANKCFGCNNDSVQEVIITSKSGADGCYNGVAICE
jgi:PP-loop superfamily ATP-utilizing enzyme